VLSSDRPPKNATVQKSTTPKSTAAAGKYSFVTTVITVFNALPPDWFAAGYHRVSLSMRAAEPGTRQDAESVTKITALPFFALAEFVAVDSMRPRQTARPPTKCAGPATGDAAALPFSGRSVDSAHVRSWGNGTGLTATVKAAGALRLQLRDLFRHDVVNRLRGPARRTPEHEGARRPRPTPPAAPTPSPTTSELRDVSQSREGLH